MMITLTLQKVQDTGEIPLEVNNIKILWLNRTQSDDCVTDAGNGNRYQPRSNFVGQRWLYTGTACYTNVFHSVSRLTVSGTNDCQAGEKRHWNSRFCMSSVYGRFSGYRYEFSETSY